MRRERIVRLQGSDVISRRCIPATAWCREPPSPARRSSSSARRPVSCWTAGRAPSTSTAPVPAAGAPAVNAAELQVAVGSLRGIAEEMGAALIHSARSPNITERRDRSTALVEPGWRLVIQAAHVPVHLGSMAAAVAAVRAAEPAPGETWALNDPYAGGRHLPDITLDLADYGRRAAGIGRVPGAPRRRRWHGPGVHAGRSTSLHQEGLIPPPTRRRRRAPSTSSGAAPAADDQRRVDLLAQLAVHHLADAASASSRAPRGGLVAARLLGALPHAPSIATGAAIAAISAAATGRDRDPGARPTAISRSAAAISIAGDRVRVDLSGSAPQHRGNLNARCGHLARCPRRRVRQTELDPPASGGACVPSRSCAGGLAGPCGSAGRGLRRQCRGLEPHRRLPPARVRPGHRRTQRDRAR